MNCYFLAPTANGPLDPLEVRRPAGAKPTGQDCFAISMEHTLRQRKIFAELFGCTHDFEAVNPQCATLNPLPMGTDGPPRLAAPALRVASPRLSARGLAGSASGNRQQSRGEGAAASAACAPPGRGRQEPGVTGALFVYGVARRERVPTEQAVCGPSAHLDCRWSRLE